jgi:hypothetical protein
MSIANLFVPNDLNLFCGTISTGTGSGSTFSTINVTDQILMTTPAAHPIQVNLTSSTSEGDILFLENGVEIFGVGDNVQTSESYVWNFANRPLKFGTNGVERLRIPAAGIAINNISSLLATSGTTLVNRNVGSLASKAVYKLAASVALTSTVALPISWDTTVVSNPNITLAGSTFTINTTGLYIFSATIAFGSDTTGTGARQCYMLRGGATEQLVNQTIPQLSNGGVQFIATSFSDVFTAGETFVVLALSQFTTSCVLLGSTSGTGSNANNFCQLNIAMIAS